MITSRIVIILCFTLLACLDDKAEPLMWEFFPREFVRAVNEILSTLTKCRARLVIKMGGWGVT